MANLRLGLNLRGDLAKLGDDELADHLQICIDRRDWLAARVGDVANRWLYRTGLAMPFGRGLFHARAFYRAMGLVYGGPLNGNSLGDLYIVDCEIKDIMDELRRRLKARGR